MTDIKYLSPRTNQCILPTHIEVLSRALRGVGVISGNAIFSTDPPSMAVVVSAGTIRIGPDVLDVSEQTVNISPSDETLYRIDVIYRDTSGNAQVLTGVPAEIINPNQLPSWTGYISPSPPEEIPDGVILGVVFVPAETETIQASYIWEFAAGVEDPVLVGDIVTSVGSPGDNSHVPSEAAVRTLADTKLNLSDIVTTLGNPGSNSKVPSEKAVRDVFNLLGVTNGNNHDHYGGDGAQISHSTLSNLTADDHTQYLNTTRHDTTARHGSSVVDHGSIGGLGDDDHTQYLNTTRHDTTSRHTPGTVVPVVTSVGSPGSDSNIPSEKAVRTAVNDMTNLATQMHALTSKATPVDADETFLIDSAASYGPKRLTWSNIKATLKSYFDTLYAVAAKGVTNGDSHDHYGGDGAQINHSTLSNLSADDHTQYLNTARHDITSRHTPGTVVPVVTSIGSPGSDNNIPSEKAVRTAVNDMTNLATQMHALTSKATPVDADETFLIDSAASYGPKRLTWSNIKATLKSYFDSLYAPSSKGVTNGDLHDHAGGDGAQISHSTLSNLTADDHTQYLNTTRHDTTARHGSSVVDHGSIGGLGDDDHTQYLNTTRHDTTSRHTPGTVVPVVTSVGSPGSDSNIPSEKAVRAAINAINVSRAINVQFENGGYVLEANQVIWVQLPNAATTITGLQMVADTTGSVVVNVKYATYSSYPTTYDQCGSAKPTLSSAQKYSTDCSSWTRKTFSAGDWVVFIIESCSTITRLNISLSVV
jgi:vacuolar-type H+-ATPase subunit F/Vma7